MPVRSKIISSGGKPILLVSNSQKLFEIKKQFLQENSEQTKIYKLCTGKSTEEIAKVIKKKNDYVYTNLRRLKEKGFIKSTKKRDTLVYEQVF